MASVQIRTRKETGKLYLDFRYGGKRCREQTDLPDTRANRKRLEQVARRIEAEMTLGTFDYAATFPNSRNAPPPEPAPSTKENFIRSTPTFKDFAEEWFRQSEVAWKSSYRQKVRDILDGHLLPAFAETPIEDITKHAVLDFRAGLANAGTTKGKTLSAGRINQVMAQLRHILADSGERFACPNPADGIKPLRETRSTVDPLSLEDVQRFLDAVEPYYRDYFLVRFFTGMRTAEIDGLKWRYVDFESRQIHIKETLVKGEETTTKTPESERFIDMASPVEAALRRQLARTGPADDVYVFQAPRGGPIHYRNVSNRIWYPTLRQLGLRPRRPYQTRHTAATLWLAAGESPEWIARQMGHADTKMLFSTYSRYVPNLTRRDGSAFERILVSHFESKSDSASGGDQ